MRKSLDEFNIIRENTPLVAQVIEILCKKSPFQRKTLRHFLVNCDDVYWHRAETVVRDLTECFYEQSIEKIVDAYLQMYQDIMLEQINFAKSGVYRPLVINEVYSEVYASETKMKSYMHGLALSIFLWPNHYKMYDFFIQKIKQIGPIRHYLEIGPGHGLFLLHALRTFPKAEFTIIDISPISIALTKQLVDYCLPQNNCKFEVKDINLFNGQTKYYDFIVMCEVLEHLFHPNLVLNKLKELLTPKGNCFITTCANCPAIDHVYQFHNIDEIRKCLESAKFNITQDLALAIQNIPCLKDNQAGINYAALLM
jgi:2-polyprenyl-3-methyl-5-hydroxy-6-metoxy-1,4-benzoquinol methylase